MGMFWLNQGWLCWILKMSWAVRIPWGVVRMIWDAVLMPALSESKGVF